MPYRHYGEIGDIWRHLPLCSFLYIEKPTKYMESNAAYPIYQLDRTPSREYGIFTLLTKSRADDLKQLKSYPYISALMSIRERNDDEISQYLGSPGLAMRSLGPKTSYVFWT